MVHVLPADSARGAQLFARTLRDHLDGQPDRHRTISLFASPSGQLRPDAALDIHSGRGRRMGLDVRAVAALRRELTDLAADLVVAHGGEALKYTVPACIGRWPVVYTKTGVSAGSLRGRLHVGLYRLLVRRAALVVGVSEESAREARELLGVPADRVICIPNGRDPGTYRPGLRTPSGEALRLLFLGHLTAVKDPHRFVEVVKRLRHRGLDVEATIVGDGPLLASLTDRAERAGIQVLGRRDDIPRVLDAVDVLLFPGRPEGEGMPGVFIEAGMCEVPVITTDVPGAGTVVEHGVTGLVVPVGDLEGLVEAVATLAADPARRARMGAAARRRCVSRWSLDSVAEQWRTALGAVPRRTASVPVSAGGHLTRR